MIVFWVAAALLSAAVAVFVIVLRAARAADRREAEDPSLGVYRRQLSELDDLAGRGLLPQAEQRSARAEAARRLLAAADADADRRRRRAGPEPACDGLAGRRPRRLSALGLYLVVGSPQTPDQPFAARLKAWRADPSKLGPTEMAAVLQQVILLERPSDPAPLIYLSHADVAAGDLVASASRPFARPWRHRSQSAASRAACLARGSDREWRQDGAPRRLGGTSSVRWRWT